MVSMQARRLGGSGGSYEPPTPKRWSGVRSQAHIAGT